MERAGTAFTVANCLVTLTELVSVSTLVIGMKARVIALAVGLLAVSRIAVAAPSVPDLPGHAPKLQIYVAKGLADSCGPGCDRWIAVEGKVEIGAAARVRQFLKKAKGTEQLPFFFHSPGGSFRDGLAIGRILRERRAVAGVGKTVVSACAGTQIDDQCLKLKAAGGEIEAKLITRGAMCNSACSYLFLGATAREVAPDAGLGVHSSKIVLRFTGHPTERQREEVMARQRSQSDRETASFVKAMGISHELVELIKTVSFESWHVLTRQELYRFGIDKRDFVQTAWTVEPWSRPYVRKMVWIKKKDEAFRTLEWRLLCDRRDRVRLMFIREIDKETAATSVEMISGADSPVAFGNTPSRWGVYEVWNAGIKPDTVRDFLAKPRLQVGESMALPDGKANRTQFEIETRGLDNAWTLLSAVCATGGAFPARLPGASGAPASATVPTR